MVPPPHQQHSNDSTRRNNAIPPPLIRGYGYAKSDPKFQDPKFCAAFAEMRRKKKEREAREEVSKKRQAIGRADGRGYQFQTPRWLRRHWNHQDYHCQCPMSPPFLIMIIL
jgi:hypothetical protein